MRVITAALALGLTLLGTVISAEPRQNMINEVYARRLGVRSTAANSGPGGNGSGGDHPFGGQHQGKETGDGSVPAKRGRGRPMGSRTKVELRAADAKPLGRPRASHGRTPMQLQQTLLSRPSTQVPPAKTSNSVFSASQLGLVRPQSSWQHPQQFPQRTPTPTFGVQQTRYQASPNSVVIRPTPHRALPNPVLFQLTPQTHRSATQVHQSTTHHRPPTTPVQPTQQQAPPPSKSTGFKLFGVEINPQATPPSPQSGSQYKDGASGSGKRSRSFQN